jgi:hypothetical protein
MVFDTGLCIGTLQDFAPHIRVRVLAIESLALLPPTLLSTCKITEHLSGPGPPDQQVAGLVSVSDPNLGNSAPAR